MKNEIKKNLFASVATAESQRQGRVVASNAQRAASMMSAIAPRSDINTPGYIHFADRFEAQRLAPLIWDIVNDKMIETKGGEYPLWKLLEGGSRYMAPRKTINPVLDIIGPEFIRESARVGR